MFGALAGYLTGICGPWHLVVRRLSDDKVTVVRELRMQSHFYAAIEASGSVARLLRTKGESFEYGITRTPHKLASVDWLTNR